MTSRTDVIVDASGVTYNTASWERPPTADPLARARATFALQLEELDLAVRETEQELVVAWDAVFAILDREDDDELALRPSRGDLPIPDVQADLVPILESIGALEDEDFEIFIAGWRRAHGGTVEVVQRVGPVVRLSDDTEALLSGPCWELVSSLERWQQRGLGQRETTANRQAWARMRPLAARAGVPLSGYLGSIDVRLAENVELSLRRVDDAAGVSIEVQPTFANAPAGWLDTFDRKSRRGVRGGYMFAGTDHDTLVVPSAQAKDVLERVRQLPQRRARGEQARRIIENPIAALAPDDDSIDEAAVEVARAALLEGTWRFRPLVRRAADGTVASVALELIETRAADGSSHLRIFPSPSLLETFLDGLVARVEAGDAFVEWDGRQIEIDSAAVDYVEFLEQAMDAWRADTQVRLAGTPASPGDSDLLSVLLIDADTVLDLDRYADRVESIGIEASYGIITVPLNARGTWLPEDEEFCFTLPGVHGQPVAMALEADQVHEFIRNVDQAVAAESATVGVPGISELAATAPAADLVAALPASVLNAARLAPDATSGEDSDEPRDRVGLLIGSNISDEDYGTARARLARPPAGPPSLPLSLRPETQLKEHQLTGVRFLQHLYDLGITECRGALLADDMGLGKTLQALTFIASVREFEADAGPALIVAPVTLLRNWEQEVDRFFLPGSLRVKLMHGADMRAHKVDENEIGQKLQDLGLTRFLRPGWHEECDLVLTTYEALRDYEFSFGDVDWGIVICDEAQKIKNPNALVSRATKKLKTRFCVAATGTPVENNLTDLWSLFDFIQPQLLPPLNTFNKQYRRPIEAQSEDERTRLAELRQLVEPQLLRRTKDEVGKDLPSKMFDDACRILPMSEPQRELYQHAINTLRLATAAGEAHTATLNALAHMRRICTDPRTTSELAEPAPPLAEYRRRSPKLDWLLRTLHDISEQREKAIVFVERRDVQRLLRDYIGEVFGRYPDVINGESGTSGGRRQQQVDDFQSIPGFAVLVLSPLAAGVGLNIQAANHVIHYMRHWNPAREDQATDRAYRIGQKKDVCVYTPLVVGDGWTSFDERLDQLLDKKRRIAGDMLNGAADIDRDELADALLADEPFEAPRLESAGAATPAEQPATPARSETPMPLTRPNWVGDLLASAVLVSQRARPGAPSIADDDLASLLTILSDAGTSVPAEQLEHRLGWDPIRTEGSIAAARELLNRDGYEVLRSQNGNRSVQLETSLLRQQFELSALSQ